MTEGERDRGFIRPLPAIAPSLFLRVRRGVPLTCGRTTRGRRQSACARPHRLPRL